MRPLFIASLLIFVAACSSTRVIRVAENDLALYPHGRAYVGWNEHRLMFPMMIHADVALPPAGESIPAQQAFKKVSILNCRSKNKKLPIGGEDAWLREMKGNVQLLSADQIKIDAYFLDSSGGRQSYPFAGRHRIVTAK